MSITLINTNGRWHLVHATPEQVERWRRDAEKRTATAREAARRISVEQAKRNLADGLYDDDVIAGIAADKLCEAMCDSLDESREMI